jgi:hypothetical protein
MNEVIGIVFSTRNRPDILEICLTQLYKFLSPAKYTYFVAVVNDLGDVTWDDQYAALMQKSPSILWHKSVERLGIAKVKNLGINILGQHNCDHYFLFDDDVFPIKCGWEELYIDTAAQNAIHHLMHQFPLPEGFEIQRNENGICEYSQCSGMLLYFTRHAIKTIGGYRKNFGIYGYEHAELSLRSNYAGLQPGWGPYIAPEKTRQYIYSIDLDLNVWSVNPPDFIVSPDMWRSSVLGEDVISYTNYNAQFINQREPVFEEI